MGQAGMMKRPRDFQRKRVYDAEVRASVDLGLREPETLAFNALRPLAECQEIVDTAITSEWWRASPKFVQPMDVIVEDGRGRRSACALATRIQYGLWSGVVKLPRWARHEMVIAHELAHVAMWHYRREPVHGPGFCKAFLYIARHMMGSFEATVLETEMHSGGAKVWWPETRAAR